MRETTAAAWPRLATMRNRAVDITATGPIPAISAKTLERGSAELTERGGSPTQHPPTRKEHPVTAAAGVSDEVWVGLDLGTQSVRALAVTGGGIVVGTGTQKLTSRRDGPRHEQDPEQWWQAVAAASREALRDVAPGGVRGVAVDATSGTVLLTDRDGDPADRRADVRRHPRRRRGRAGQRGRRAGLA